MRLLLPVLCALSVAPIVATAAEQPDAEKSKEPCVVRPISTPYNATVAHESTGSVPNIAARNAMTSSRLSGKEVCMPVSARPTQPTKLVRVKVGRGITAWKVVPVDAG